MCITANPKNNILIALFSLTGVAAINQYIYVVGGFDGSRQLNSVERFDTENKVWETATPVTIARSALSLTSLDDKLYAIGGFDGNQFLSIVEVFDPKTNTWTEGTPLKSGRSGHASAVIYQPASAMNSMDCMDIDTIRRGGAEDSSDRGGSESGAKSPDHQGFYNATSNTHFHASFGSSGCRNCEDEFQPPDAVILEKYLKGAATKEFVKSKHKCRVRKSIKCFASKSDFSIIKPKIEPLPFKHYIEDFSLSAAILKPIIYNRNYHNQYSLKLPEKEKCSASSRAKCKWLSSKSQCQRKCPLEMIKNTSPAQIVSQFFNALMTKHCNNIAAIS